VQRHEGGVKRGWGGREREKRQRCGEREQEREEGREGGKERGRGREGVK